MKYLFVLYLSLALPVICGAQTKKIAYKSHSGAEDLFAVAYEHHLFDMDLDNEGLNEEAYYHTRLDMLPDTMIRINNTLLPSHKSALRPPALTNAEDIMK